MHALPMLTITINYHFLLVVEFTEYSSISARIFQCHCSKREQDEYIVKRCYSRIFNNENEEMVQLLIAYVHKTVATGNNYQRK